MPTVYNVTLIGDHAYTGAASFAAVFRRGTGGHYFNHIWFGFPKGPEFRDAETLGAARRRQPRRSRTRCSSATTRPPTNLPPPQATGDIDEATYINAARERTSSTSIRVCPAARSSTTAPDFKPRTAAAITGGATPPDDGFFDTTATFVGAIGADDWTSGWTAYPQN